MKCLKISIKWKKKFGKTSETMASFFSETPVTGFNRPNTGKNDGGN
jgi:hypothetical protein